MSRFLPISIVLGEVAALHGRQPTAEQFTMVEDDVRKRMVIDLDRGMVGIRYDDGFVGDPAAFIESALTRSWIETRSTAWAASDFEADL